MFSWLVKSLIKKKKFGRALHFLECNVMAEGSTYSQNFEDLIVMKLLDVRSKKQKGIYVDVGAHDPIRFSNTLQLYLAGWNGINIDPMPECRRKFKQYRPDDINLNVAVSSEESMLEYYAFEEPAYNCMSKERADDLVGRGITKLKSVTKVRSVSLKRIFDKYIKDKKIDLLTIDVETMELDVLQSNDWSKYSPELIVMESIVSCYEDICKVYEDRAVNFLKEKGYIVVAKVENAVFLKKTEAVR